MVALRGRKTSATAKPKAVEKAAAGAHAKSGKTSGKEDSVHTEASAQAQAQQQKLALRKEEEFAQMLRFATRSSLALRKIPADQTIASFCSGLLTACCGSGKDRHLTPPQILAKLTRTARKRVCGAVFSADEIAYSCRNCQLDATCVTCKDCFMHSDHTGHDVYFQRTTAGSSCDCGDPHAWKRSGFCSKHQGMDTSETGASRKHRLPKSLALVAPVVIDAVIEHVYQVLLGVHYGFELADAFELFTRNIPPEFLPIHAQSELEGGDEDADHHGSGRSSAPSGVSTTNNSPLSPPDGFSSGNVASDNSTSSVAENADDSPVAFAIRLHNDDCHTMNEVVNHLCVALDFSKLSGRAVADQTDRVGDAVVSKRALLKCPLVVGNLLRRSLNISVVPVWLEAQLQDLADIFGWLQSISTMSDGLGELVSEALSKKRNPELSFFDKFTSEAANGHDIAQFAKECGVRLHNKAASILESLVGVDNDVGKWMAELESNQKQHFKLWAAGNASSSSLQLALPSASHGPAQCQNLFIEEFIKAVSQSGPYTRHASVREGFNAVVSKYFSGEATGSDGSADAAFSALKLLVQYDCTLRKATVDQSHALLREHLLEIDFRTHLLEAYMQCYKRMTNMFLRGLGNASESIFDFAVQFLTVPQLVKGYTCQEASKHEGRRQIIGELLEALQLVFKSAIDPKTGSLNPDHSSLSNQKYKHCVENMEYVFNIGSFSSELVCDVKNMDLWLACLGVIQGGDPQVRRGVNQSHVEYESDSWLSMFNLGIRVHSVFAVSWNGFCSAQLETAGVTLADVFRPILGATIKSSTMMNGKIAKKSLVAVTQLLEAAPQTSEHLDKSIVSFKFNVASDPTSLHIPLHRYLCAALRQITVFQTGFEDCIATNGFLHAFGIDQLSFEAKQELVELPLRCLVMASQIHSGLWRRNGDENMLAQLYNYSALPYCIHYRDADVFMLQVGVLMVGADDIVARMMDHFQLGDYFAVSAGKTADNQDASSVSDSTSTQFGYAQLEEGIDNQQRLQMLEEFLRLIIIVGTALPSSTGTTHENEFLLEEMLQQLCSKSQSFSKLFELAILPSGQDDIPVARLEGVLSKVAEFVPPSGLESGRYELKDGLLEQYNPYFLHLNREAHELARDRWTSYRNLRRRKAERDGGEKRHPHEPLKAAATPLPFLRPVRDILTCESTLMIVHVILWHVLCAENLSSSNVVSDAVISTSLHLLVHGVHTAAASGNEEFWSRLCRCAAATDNLSIVHLLSMLLEKAATLLDGEQTGTLEWLIWKINLSSPDCGSLFKKLDSNKASQGVDEASGSNSAASSVPAPLTLDQRKAEARERALAAMARQQAAFQAMMKSMGEDDDEEEKEADEERDLSEVDDQMGTDESQRKRRGIDGEHDVKSKKRQKVVTNDKDHKCILCHDTHEAGQMGMAAYLHQSTVLASGFRPDPHEALGADGKKVRSQVKDIIAKMELCSGMTAASDAASPIIRAFSAPPLPEWYIAANADEGVPRDGPPTLTSPRTTPRRHRHERIRFTGGQLPMLDGELLQTDEELDLLEGVVDMQDDQRLFPFEPHVPINPREAGGMRGRRPRPMTRRFDAPPPNMTVIFDDSEDEAEFDPSFHRAIGGPPGFDDSIHNSSKLYLTPCGLHIRTCQHAVHIDCLERYITSLHDKAIRGEDFDGVQAIDPDSAMTQFLCPLCKTLSNFLIPMSMPVSSPSDDEEKRPVSHALVDNADADENGDGSTWVSTIERQLRVPGWCRTVLGRDDAVEDLNNLDEHNLWREYFEETLWEPHGSLEKGAPFLWSACGFTLASFLLVVEDEFRTVSSNQALFDPLTDRCPPSLEKEFESVVAVTKFCRWSFLMLEHSADAKVIWETSKRCCPINCETKREYRKFTNVLGSVDACLRGTILGLLVADSFTAFVVSSVVAQDPATVWRIMPVFSVADMLQRLYDEFFQPTKVDETSLFQDKYTADASASSGDSSAGAATVNAPEAEARRTRSGLVIGRSGASSRSRSTSSQGDDPSATAVETITNLMDAMVEAGEQDAETFAVLAVLRRMAADDPTDTLKPLSARDIGPRMANVLRDNSTFVRRMKLFWRCLAHEEEFAERYDASALAIPTIQEIAESPAPVFNQVWRWCADRVNSKTFLGVAKAGGDKCEHTEGCSEAYVASMFILREVPTKPQLIDLPIQYDELYSAMSGRKCDRCGKSPSDPGICLVCGEFLCCGDSCCTRAFIAHGPPVGECTRHAAECGGGIGVVLLLDQCRVAIIGGSMAAHFPSPYVDAHGEEDVGLQRGRPLRLDMARYRYLESLWLQQRVFGEVSRQRNQRDPQYTINLSYL